MGISTSADFKLCSAAPRTFKDAQFCRGRRRGPSGVHASHITQKAVSAFRGKIVSHFLPPCRPGDDKIKRCAVREQHAKVPRIYRCKTMDKLMQEVHDYLVRNNRQHAAQRRRKAA